MQPPCEGVYWCPLKEDSCRCTPRSLLDGLEIGVLPLDRLIGFFVYAAVVSPGGVYRALVTTYVEAQKLSAICHDWYCTRCT